MGSSLETSTVVPVVDAARILSARDARVIDLRSPSEFADDHVPGARNVPLFDDVERAVIGTLYARVSPEAAFAEGRERTLRGIEALARQIAGHVGWTLPEVDLRERVQRMCAGGLARLEGELRPEPVSTLPAAAVVLHCWRGGLRSRSIVAFLRGLGLERAVGLAEGYKGYREEVRRRLAGFAPPRSFVLRGLTGVGKTLVLRELERLRPGWTLDLEALAGHRSSILGMVGLQPCSQKTFESRLVRRIDAGFPGVLVVEGESRKVGDAIIPPRVWDALTDGTDLELTASLERRVQVLTEDYLAAPDSRAQLTKQLPFIEKRLGRGFAGELVGLLASGREAELVEVLLARYYDPLYAHSEKRHDYRARFDVADPTAAAARIATWIDEQPR